jgi:hypothetical protein
MSSSHEREQVMAQHGPLVTAVVVVGGLIGLMTVNSVGGLVTTASAKAPPATSTTAPAPTTTEAPPTTTTEPPPPAPAFPAEVVYAGRATGGPLAIAVAVKGAEAAAYLCDGANVEAWLKGTAKDGRVDLASSDGTNTLTGGLDGVALAGTVLLAGQQQAFSIATAPAPAGLYRGEGDTTTLGWIVLPDGTQVGIAKSAAGKGPAPKLDPATGAVLIGGATVPADKVAGDTTFG